MRFLLLLILYFILFNSAYAEENNISLSNNNALNQSAPRVVIAPGTDTIEKTKHFFNHADLKHLKEPSPRTSLSLSED